MTAPYTLYGSHASYFTAKTRSYLRKKGIPFVERLPAAPRFRAHVRPASGSHRIPQLEAPDGTVVQDTSAIIDYLEPLYPDPPGYPPGSRQQLAARLLEVLVDEALVAVAWHYRWDYPEENTSFVGREFGRSFRPRGSDEEIEHYGRVIADRMEGYRGAIGITPAVAPALEAIYDDVLAILEAHLIDTPYLFGGLPSVADHALMGPLFGHLARDPAPAMRMKQRAPRVFRWTEHMNTPEIEAPEFAEVPAAYRPDDELPEGTQALLRLCLADGSEGLVTAAARYAAWLEEHPGAATGTPIGEQAEPVLGRAGFTLRGVAYESMVRMHPLWVLQRAFDWLDAQDPASQRSARELVAKLGGEALLGIRLPRPLVRVEGRLAVG